MGRRGHPVNWHTHIQHKEDIARETNISLHTGVQYAPCIYLLRTPRLKTYVFDTHVVISSGKGLNEKYSRGNHDSVYYRHLTVSHIMLIVDSRRSPWQRESEVGWPSWLTGSWMKQWLMSALWSFSKRYQANHPVMKCREKEKYLNNIIIVLTKLSYNLCTRAYLWLGVHIRTIMYVLFISLLTVAYLFCQLQKPHSFFYKPQKAILKHVTGKPINL